MIGIIILNYKTGEDVKRCVECADKCTLPTKYYIVDNDSQDGSYEKLSEYYAHRDDVVVTQSGANRGYSVGNNIGIRQAIDDKCSELVLLNPDVELHENALEYLYQSLVEHPEVAVVGGKVISASGKVQRYCKPGITYQFYLSWRVPGRFFDYKKIRFSVHNMYIEDKEYTFDGMVSGCCNMIRTSVMEQIGLLDENVFLYYEEDIIWSKLHKLGWLTMIQPKAVMLHNHSVSIGSIDKPFARLHDELSAIYYLRCYRGLKGIKFWWVRTVSLTHFLIINIVKGYGFEKVKELRAGLKKIKKYKCNQMIDL